MQFHRKSYVSKYVWIESHDIHIRRYHWHHLKCGCDKSQPPWSESYIYMCVCVCPTNSSIAAHCDKKQQTAKSVLLLSHLLWLYTYNIYIILYIYIYSVYIYIHSIYIYTVYIHTHIVIRNPKIFHKVGLMLGRTVWYHVSQTKCHRPQLISYATKQPVQSEANATKA